jgi:hypothetical protein
LTPSSASRSAPLGLGVTAVGVSTALVATLWGAAVNLHLRPLDGVEGDLLFEASRIRAGLALYTDPLQGAADYGAIPARYYVLYPPLWAGFLSLWPSTWAETIGRLVSCGAWWGLLAWLAVTARGVCRVPAALAAAFVGGVYSLAEFGGSARPDALALALAGVALARSVRRGEVDALSAALFTLAVWTKPNVLGMGVGAMAATAFIAPRRGLRAAAGAAGVSLVLGIVLEGVSSGAWLRHLIAGTGQPLHLRLFVHHVLARGQFFLFFLGVAAFFAWKAGRSSVMALASLASALAWALFTFAKTGSAANYWMEPCVAAVVVFARVSPPRLSSRAWLALTFAVPLQALWTGVGSVRATFESIDANRDHSRLLDRARAVCGAGPDDLVVADEPGIEMALDGRLVAHAFPLTHAILRGQLEAAPWLRDLGRKEIACVVTAHDRIERPETEVDVDYDDFAPQVRAALSARFAPAASSSGWEVYAPRPDER